MEETIRAQVEESLKKSCSMEWEQLKPNIQEHLLKIEGYFQSCISTYEDSINHIKNINLSTRGICEGSKVSKSTIYGTPIPLREYVESRVDEISKMFYSEKIKNLEDDFHEVKALLDNNLEMFIQDKRIEYQFIELQKENSRIQEKLNLAIQKNSRLVAENAKLKQELHLTKQLNKKVTNVVDFKE